jgi:protein-S-isoprenylcysteine O-methyltransferase Ste14
MNRFFADNRILLSRIISTLLILFIVFNHPKTYGSFAYSILFILGNVFVMFGILGRIFASIFMSDNRNVSLVSTGLYSITRNPLYFFSFLGTIGIGLAYGSIIVLIALIALYLTYYHFVISFEEENLSKRLGEPYIAYLKSGTPRLFPKFSLWKSEEYLKVNYKVVLQTIVDAFWFFFVILAIQLLLKLQSLNIIPTLFNVW